MMLKYLLLFTFEAHGWQLSVPVKVYDSVAECEKAGHEMVELNYRRDNASAYGCYEKRAR